MPDDKQSPTLSGETLSTESDEFLKGDEKYARRIISPGENFDRQNFA